MFINLYYDEKKSILFFKLSYEYIFVCVFFLILIFIKDTFESNQSKEAIAEQK